MSAPSNNRTVRLICPVDGMEFTALGRRVFCSKRCHDAANGWVAAEPAGHSEFAKASHDAVVALERLERARDKLALARTGGRFAGTAFTDTNRSAVDRAIAAHDSARTGRLMESLATVATDGNLPSLPIQQDPEFVRQEEALIAADVPRKLRRKILRKRGWELLP